MDALFSGGIELENLTLKKTALDAFELPIEVRSGKLLSPTDLALFCSSVYCTYNLLIQVAS